MAIGSSRMIGSCRAVHMNFAVEALLDHLFAHTSTKPATDADTDADADTNADVAAAAATADAATIKGRKTTGRDRIDSQRSGETRNATREALFRSIDPFVENGLHENVRMRARNYTSTPSRMNPRNADKGTQYQSWWGKS
ncbi:hypothetical protein V1477_013945 [Vespula maculifrons]|uniref:Uncharacterized protein n=1 Tax=Vespula maculifrons TaxID=7453 RepID=A0ABD2BL44_VESMC